MESPLVIASGVSKKFCRDFKRSLLYGLSDIGSTMLGHGTAAALDERPGEFWALRDVHMTLRRGECLGLLGHNGAGKTTLLRILNGLIRPDAGRVETRGRVAAIIALGAGFNPILSGRENIYINAAILGLKKKDIDEKIEEIIDFAELRESIDMPVQSYSSGMTVRLGFSIATAMSPDVLFLDEVLAVGDASFRHKCYNRLGKIMESCATIMVSHGMDQIAMVCTRVGIMNRGRLTLFDDVGEGIRQYERSQLSENLAVEDPERSFAVYPPVVYADIHVTEKEIVYGGQLRVSAEIVTSAQIDDVDLAFTAFNGRRQPVMSWVSRGLGRPIVLKAGKNQIEFVIDPVDLHGGEYTWSFRLGQSRLEALVFASRAGTFTVNNKNGPCFDVPYLPKPQWLLVKNGASATLIEAA
jgi:lipopolysaccharide transport system ATP-binding protein